ncbi:MAG: serine/threonine-protein kinase [Myxococcota bacterium]
MTARTPEHEPAYEPTAAEDSLRAEIIDLRPDDHLEVERLESSLAERMFGVSSDPPRIGRFVILSRLGTGGMGVVYSAYDPRLDRRVALKLVRDGGRSRHLRERLLREAHALARISHPNVVTVHEVGELDDRIFIVMEFVVGSTLKEWASARRRRWPEVLAVYRQAARGLAAAHVAGLVHRDFKPANALIGDDGRVRVVDFGLVRDERWSSASGEPSEEISGPRSTAHAEPTRGTKASGSCLGPLEASLTRPNTILGTPAYMSPEQFLQQAAGPASDQFSFCVALYEALYGERPFAGQTPLALMKHQLDGKLREPPRGAGIPAWLLTALRRGLCPRPEDRHASMDALLKILERDSARGRRWFIGLAGLAGAAATSSLLVATPAPDLPCESSDRALRGAWGAKRRTTLQTHFDTLSTPYADTLGSRVLATLDDYVARWHQMHRDACLAHHHGEQSGALLDKRMACLERRRAALDSVHEVLSTTDAAAFESAAMGVFALPPLYPCEDLESLAAEVPLPEDPVVAQEIEQVRQSLARTRTLASAGQHTESYWATDASVTRARALGYEPLLAEALLMRGVVEMDPMSDGARVSATLFEALRAGLASGSDVVATEALIRRLYVEAIRVGGREIREDEDYPLVESMLEHLPDPTRLRGLFLNNAGVIATTRQDFASARRYYQQALAVWMSAPEVNPIDVLKTRFNLATVAADEASQVAGMEHSTEALARELGPLHPLTIEFGCALARSTRDPLVAHRRLGERCKELDRVLPEDHSRISTCRYDLGLMAARLGAFESATHQLDRAVALLEGKTPPLQVLQREASRGYALFLRGQPQRAIEPLRVALARASDVEPRWLLSEVAQVHLMLGEVLMATSQSQEARGHLRQALERFEDHGKHRVDMVTEQRLARSQLLLARALVEQPAEHRAPGRADAEELRSLLDAAEAWYRRGGTGYARQLAQIETLRVAHLATQ